MFTTLKKLFWVSRPISWPNTAYPFAAAYLVAGGQLDLTFWIGVVYFLGPYNLLMYGINDVFDYESDIQNPRKGGIEGMREQKAFHPTIVRAAIISNLPFVIYFLTIGNWVSRLTFILVIFFVLAYSVAHLRFKEKAILDAVTSSLHFVGPMIFALTLTQFTAEAWPYCIAFFLWGMASQAFGAVQDIIPDRAGGLHSIATFFGARWTVRIAVALYLVAAAIMLAQGWPIALIGVAGLLYVANIIRYWNTSDADSYVTNPAWRRFIWLNFITGFIVTIVILYVTIVQPAQALQAATKNELVTLLKNAAEEQQAELPKRLNDTVALIAVSSDNITFRYTFEFAPNVDESSLSGKNLKTPLVSPLCSAVSSRTLLDKGATFKYDYIHSQSGNKYGVSITKTDC